MSRFLLIAAPLALTSVVGCAPPKDDAGSGEAADTEDETGADEEGESDPSAQTWHRDIKPIMETHCVGCHQEGAIGTFSLDTFESVSLISEQVADAVASRRMPPWKAAEGCDEYRDDISLSQDEIDLIVDWVDSGKPEGDPATAVDGEIIPVAGLERVDLTLELPIAYTPSTDVSDDYRCFPVQWPLDEDVYVTGYQVNPGQADLVHHVIAYIAPGGYAEALMAEEAEDGAPGYTCYGGPGVIDQVDAAWLGAWAPGASQGTLPNGVGLEMKAGDWLILQMHYNTASGVSAADQTSIDFQVETEVERYGWIQPFADPNWVLSHDMPIPAQTEGVTHGYAYDMLTDLEFHSANLHMHTLGKRANMTLTKADGTEDCMLQIDDWDFDWQRSYVFQRKKSVSAGDTWSIECEWDNPTDEDVSWGEGTGDEMCLGSVLMSLP